MSSVRTIALSFLLFGAQIQAQQTTQLSGNTKNYGDIPAAFEENHGQWGGLPSFLYRTKNLDLFVTKSGAMLDLRDGDKRAAVKLELLGTPGLGNPVGELIQPGQASYIRGNDPAKWVSGVKRYQRVRVNNVRDGVDLLFYPSTNRFEYDLVVKPGTRVEDVRMQFAGADKISLTKDGDLRIETAAGELIQHKPRIWQPTAKGRVEIAGRYRISKGGDIAVSVGRYDRNLDLVIDPVVSYATYLGGNQTDSASAIAVDSAGDAYITGQTYSANFPTTVGAYSVAEKASSQDVFVTKLNPQGTALVYSTYIGGSSYDTGTAIAVDSNGNAYVTGSTQSVDFPVTAGVLQAVRKSSSSTNVFVSKLNSSGTALAYSTYLGGSYIQTGTGIQVDSSGNAYVTGFTSSTDFPATTGSYKTSLPGSQSAFIAKINPAATQLVWATYLGGSNSDSAAAITLDSSNNVYVAGQTQSTNFPATTGAFQTAPASSVTQNGFVAEVSADGTALLAATYLGGNANTYSYYQSATLVYAIALDSSNNAYVTGSTYTPSFPTTSGAFSTMISTQNYNSHAFVSKFNPALTSLGYSSFLAGSGTDGGYAITVDGAGRAYVAGYTSSVDFPLTPGAVMTRKNPGGTSAFVTQVAATGSTLGYSTLFGGTGAEYAYGVAVDGNQGLYIAGSTTSLDLPSTSGAFQTTNGGSSSNSGDAYAAKIDLSSQTSCTQSIYPASYAAPLGGGSSSFTITVPAGCPWVVYNPSTTITFTGPTRGYGNATVNFTVPSNAGSANTVAVSLLVGGSTFAISQPAGSCSTPIVSPGSASFSSTGGLDQLSIAIPYGCSYSAVSSAPWLNFTSGTPGNGSGLINFFVDRNDFAARAATVTVAGASIAVSQAGAGCTVSVANNSGTGAAGGTGYISLTTSANTCVWEAYSLAPWIQLSSTSGTGSAAVSMVLAANPGTTPRFGQVLIAGQTVSVSQAAGPIGTPSSYTISTIAGTGTSGFSGDGGLAASAQLYYPEGIAYDSSGNLYIADYDNYRIRKVAVNGIISTVAGIGANSDSGNGGSATAAGVSAPYDVKIDSAGTLYILETPNLGIIRKISNGLISQVATGVGTYSLAVDQSGNLYTGAYYNVEKSTPSGSNSIFAGGNYGFGGDGGSPTSALFGGYVYGLTLDSSGGVYISDSGNARVRRVFNNVVNTVAGSSSSGFNGDGVATASFLSNPAGMTVDSNGNVILADSGNGRIRRFTLGGNITTIAGVGGYNYGSSIGDGGPALSAYFSSPFFVAIDPFGNIAVSDPNAQRVRLLTPSYNFCTFSLFTSSSTASGSGTTLNAPLTTASGCAWNAYSLASWITLSTPGGTGSATVSLQVAANFNGATRTGIVSIGGQTFTVTQPGSFSPSVFIDGITGTPTFTGTVGIGGWALESTAGVGTAGISSVTVWVDNVQVGTASYGSSRTDVCGAYPGRIGCPNVGWTYSLNVTALTPGIHSLKITATDTSAASTSIQVNFMTVPQPSVYIDNLPQNTSLSGIVGIGGWALESSSAVGPAAIRSVNVFIDGTQVGAAAYGSSRPDVCAALPGRLGCPNVGWTYTLDVNALPAGSHTLKVVATDTINNTGFSQVTFTAGSTPSIYVDTQIANTTLAGTVGIGGWAIEDTSAVGPSAIAVVTVFVDGLPLGFATYGSPRPDVCAAFPGRIGCPNVGWTYSLNVAALSAGSHTFNVEATSADNHVSFSPVVTFTASPTAPSVYIDTPANNATLSGIVGMGGWALENTAVAGPSAISSVTVFVDGAQVGTAAYGSPRADVCAAFPGRRGCPNVGWTYSLNTSTLAAGTHVLKIVATDALGVSSFSQINFTSSAVLTPSVYIDSPAPNATLSGIVGLGGWALESAGGVGTSAISSVTVFVDGTQVGIADYGSSRSDVCAAFPGRLGCPNVGWTYTLNVSSLSAGAHTLKVVATDSSSLTGFSQLSFTK
jgi:sugar lactone lactonase YvrE